MTLRSLLSLAVAVIAAFVLCAGGLAGLVGGEAATAGCVPPEVPASNAPTVVWPETGGWDSDQVGNAATIVTTGARLEVPARGWVIAVATAIQESGLRNLAGGDRDSVGLFQQRPSQGWGTPTQLQDPSYASQAFYRKLVTIAGWEAMPLTDAAQAVQVSAYPDAYAKHENAATDLVTTIADTLDLPADGLAGCGPAGPWTAPVHAPLVSGFRIPQRPGHDGVDLAAPRGTLIRAAAAGTVRTVACDAVHADSGADWGCDRDGDPVRTRGCGWYVDLEHPGGLLTRYCHMDQPPIVRPGQQVVAGQPLGVVGSTGHSSGPHLHYEVRVGRPAHDNRAHGYEPVDPVAHHSRVGAPLGHHPPPGGPPPPVPVPPPSAIPAEGFLVSESKE
ncbi:M23 family metallopeptidase [Polymorphospora rubra]